MEAIQQHTKVHTLPYPFLNILEYTEFGLSSAYVGCFPVGISLRERLLVREHPAFKLGEAIIFILEF